MSFYTEFPCRLGFTLKPNHGCGYNTLIKATKDMGMRDTQICVHNDGHEMVLGIVANLQMADRITRCRLVDKCVLMYANPDRGLEIVH